MVNIRLFRTLYTCLIVIGVITNLPVSAKVHVADLNITTMIPEESPSYARPEHKTSTKQKTIHDVCKRIHDYRDHAIDTVITTESKPTKRFRVISGIPAIKDDVIFVLVGGWAGWPGGSHYKYHGNGAYISYLFEKSSIIPGVCVSFDHPMTRAKANFGQKLDQKCLKTVLHLLRKANPHASIVLIGACVGATTILNFVTQQPQEELAGIKALILESPSISLDHIEAHIMKSYLGKVSRSVPKIFKRWFRNYNPKMPTILTTGRHIPHDLPILIGAIKNDKIANYSDIKKIVRTIKQNGNKHTHLFMHTTGSHGQLGKIKEFPQVINAFLRRYDLPHNAHYADKGKHYLA